MAPIAALGRKVRRTSPSLHVAFLARWVGLLPASLDEQIQLRRMRILKVVALLVALGAVAGAVMGLLLSIGLTLVSLSPSSSIEISDLQVYGMAAAFGAIVGGVTGPPIALIFLRRVPLWRATVETAGAAGVGAAIGMSVRAVPLGWAYGALLLAILAAVRLHRVYRSRPAAAGLTSTDGL